MKSLDETIGTPPKCRLLFDYIHTAAEPPSAQAVDALVLHASQTVEGLNAVLAGFGAVPYITTGFSGDAQVPGLQLVVAEGFAENLHQALGRLDFHPRAASGVAAALSALFPDVGGFGFVFNIPSTALFVTSAPSGSATLQKVLMGRRPSVRVHCSSAVTGNR